MILQHAVYFSLTQSGVKVTPELVATNLVDFAQGLSEEVASVLSDERCRWEISVDLAVTMSPDNASQNVIVVPRGEYYAGGGGSSGRSGVGFEGGRAADLGFDATKFSLFGSDECSSISGLFSVPLDSVKGLGPRVATTVMTVTILLMS